MSVRGLLRGLEAAVVDQLDRWLLDRHRPFDIAGDGTGPAVCPTCKASWPCDEFVRIDHRVRSRRLANTDG